MRVLDLAGNCELEHQQTSVRCQGHSRMIPFISTKRRVVREIQPTERTFSWQCREGDKDIKIISETVGTSEVKSKEGRHELRTGMWEHNSGSYKTEIHIGFGQLKGTLMNIFWLLQSSGWQREKQDHKYLNVTPGFHWLPKQ